MGYTWWQAVFNIEIMDILAKDVPVNRFFAVADPPPNNVYMMCVPPKPEHNNQGTCININDDSYWLIDGNRFVRLISKDEHDQKVFHV